jgi:hypothetical protein
MGLCKAVYVHHTDSPTLPDDALNTSIRALCIWHSNAPDKVTSREPSIMRLLHSETFEFTEFHGDNIPPYAILSHTWASDPGHEVSFQEMRDGTGTTKPGYQKIKMCGEIAKSNKLSYFWVDTCAIDKTSSAELSESINSMFEWYRNAAICYAYLSDIVADEFTLSTPRSRWVSRGWTLQELIAPRQMVFFNANWKELGSRSALSEPLAQFTGIDVALLKNVSLLHEYSVAQKFSWAADRKTTRVEDTAYSLLGLFNANIPLLYGEGERSFRRLQEEIIRSSHDQSIFAWQSNDRSEMFCGLLAKSPNDFRYSGNISSLDFISRGEPIAATSRGIRAPFYLNPSNFMRGHFAGVYEAHLECYIGKDPKHRPLIYLMRTTGYEAPGGTEVADMNSQYTRLESSRMRTIDPISPLESGPQGRHAYVWVDDYKTNLDTPLSARKHVFFRIHNLTGMHCAFFPKSDYDFRLEAFVAERPQPDTKLEKEWFRVYLSEMTNQAGRGNSLEADYLVILGMKGIAWSSERPWSAMMARPDSLQSVNTSWPTSVRERFDLAKIWRVAGTDYKPRSADGMVSELDIDKGKRLKVRILSDDGGAGLLVVEVPVVISIE